MPAKFKDDPKHQYSSTTGTGNVFIPTRLCASARVCSCSHICPTSHCPKLYTTRGLKLYVTLKQIGAINQSALFVVTIDRLGKLGVENIIIVVPPITLCPISRI